MFRAGPEDLPDQERPAELAELLQEEKVLLVQAPASTGRIRTTSVWSSCRMKTICVEAIARIARFLENYRKRHGTN